MAKPRLNDADLAARLQAQPSTLRAWHIREPDLVFGRGGKSPDPQDGPR